MLEIHAMFPEERDAYFANIKMCTLFQGLEAFVNNDIIVTPVLREVVEGRVVWSFNISLADPVVNRRVTIVGGELLLSNGQNNHIWAFSGADNDEAESNKE